jgi:hypothetical protein
MRGRRRALLRYWETTTGSRLTAARPTTPSPQTGWTVAQGGDEFIFHMIGGAQENSSIARRTRKSLPPSVPLNWTAWETILVSTVSKSKVELTA